MGMIKVELNPNYRDDAITLQCGSAAYGRLRAEEGLGRRLEKEIGNRIRAHRHWVLAVLIPGLRYFRYKSGRRVFTVRIDYATAFMDYREADEQARGLLSLGRYSSVLIVEVLSECPDAQTGLEFADGP